MPKRPVRKVPGSLSLKNLHSHKLRVPNKTYKFEVVRLTRGGEPLSVQKLVTASRERCR